MTRDEYLQLKGVVSTVDKAVTRVTCLTSKEYLRAVMSLEADLYCAVESVNRQLLESASVNFFDRGCLKGRMFDYGQKEEVIRQFKTWCGRMMEILEEQYHAENSWDEKFVKLMNRVEYTDFGVMVEQTKDALTMLDRKVYESICEYYRRLHYMWGTLEPESGRYDVILNRVRALKEHREDFIWLYGRLGDWRSRIVLVSMLYHWISFDLNYLIYMREANYSDYFDLDLVQCDENEVVADLGAWTGDSTLNYIMTYGKYRKIFCYEIDKSSMEMAKTNLNGFSDIEFINKGVGSKAGRMYYAGTQLSGSNRIVEANTGREVEVVRLDDDIMEKVTLIKMDIEGAEQQALLGCKRHIEEEKPKLLISVYHNNEDIWKIPRMTEKMNPEYKFYLRSNGKQWGPAEIVFYAL